MYDTILLKTSRLEGVRMIKMGVDSINSEAPKHTELAETYNRDLGSGRDGQGQDGPKVSAS